MRKSGSLAKDTRSNFGLTHWLVILLLMAFGYFANGSMNDGLNTYVGLFTGRYGWTSGQLLTYSTYAGWASILVIIAYTQFARRRGARMTAIVAMTVAAAGMFLWARVTTQAMYFVSVLLLVSSSSAIMVIRDTTLNNWFPTKKGLALGWATMGPLIGTATILPLINWAGETFGFPGHFDVIAVGFVTLLLLSIFWFRDNPEDKGCFPDNDRTMTREKALELHRRGLRYSATSPWTTARLLRTRQVWQIGVGVGGLNNRHEAVYNHFLEDLVNDMKESVAIARKAGVADDEHTGALCCAAELSVRPAGRQIRHPDYRHLLFRLVLSGSFVHGAARSLDGIRIGLHDRRLYRRLRQHYGSNDHYRVRPL